MIAENPSDIRFRSFLLGNKRDTNMNQIMPLEVFSLGRPSPVDNTYQSITIRHGDV
jgi:hypothetical protein